MALNELIDKAVNLLRQGGTVAFATETVYGLGANAADLKAVAKIFQIKGRPLGHPLIVHIADRQQLSAWAVDVSADAERLANAFWPGPMTLILKKSPQALDLVTGGQATIGLRVPGHPVAQALLRAWGGGLAAPSANRFGRISPTTAAAVREELGDAVDLILDGGQCPVGVESTIIDMTGEGPMILRPGGISAQQVMAVLNKDIGRSHAHSPRVSGSLASHYAPLTPTKLVPSAAAFLQQLQPADLPCVLLVNAPLAPLDCPVDIKVMPSGPERYAYELYATLRTLDTKGYRQIVIEAVPAGQEWEAVADRITKASQATSPLTD